MRVPSGDHVGDPYASVSVLVARVRSAPDARSSTTSDEDSTRDTSTTVRTNAIERPSGEKAGSLVYRQFPAHRSSRGVSARPFVPSASTSHSCEVGP